MRQDVELHHAQIPTREATVRCPHKPAVKLRHTQPSEERRVARVRASLFALALSWHVDTLKLKLGYVKSNGQMNVNPSLYRTNGCAERPKAVVVKIVLSPLVQGVAIREWQAWQG